MRNFIQPGNTVTVVAPSGGVSSGDGVLIGSLFGVACGDALMGAEVELATVGVYDLEKATGVEMTAGGAAFFDASTEKITSVAAGNTLVGVALAAAGSSDEIARVRLNGVFGAASAADLDALELVVSGL